MEAIVLLLTLVLGCLAQSESGASPSQCGETSCSLQQQSVCSDLLGRESGYIGPQRLPQDSQLSEDSLRIGHVALNFIVQQTQAPEVCYEYSIHLLCLVGEPPCNNSTQTSLLLCPATCHAYDKLIKSGFCDGFIAVVRDTLQSSPNVDFPEFIRFAEYFNNFNCSNTTTYFQSERDEECRNLTSSCTNLFSPENQELILRSESFFMCEPLSGTLCQTLFPDTFMYSIQVPGRASSESEVFDVLSELASSLDDMCNDWLTLTACNYLHPACNENGEQLVFCEGQCEMIREILQEQCHLDELLGSLTDPTINPFITRGLQSNCSDPDTYLIPGVPIDNKTCFTMIDIFSMSSDPEDDVSTALYVGVIVAGVIVGAVTVVLTAVVTFACARKHTREKMREVFMSQDFFRHLSRSRSLTRQLKNTNRNGTGNRMCTLAPAANEHGENERALKLTDSERRHFEQQFSGSVIKFSRLSVGDSVGQGAFGKVYSGSVEKEGNRTAVAIKIIRSITSEDQLKEFLAESLIMKDFRHPHILGLIGVCFDAPDSSPYIILPFMANGSVKNYLREKRVHPTNFDAQPLGLKVADLVWMCMEIDEGMKYLTENKFVHRDLAARNCMVNEEGTVLVGDFGLARDVYFADYYKSSASKKLPVKWMAPETLNDGISNEKTDVWSYGVTCWEVFSLGRSPYPGIENHEILQHISSGGRLKKPSLCPDQLFSILKLCWHAQPEERPTFRELSSLLREFWDEEHLYIVQSFNHNN